MPIELPVLDDRNYEQILGEALQRIPVHTPEWTNFAIESDPGVTLVQLFAFLTESLLYRANRIPERSRLKFLQLLDIPLQPAAAAEGLIAIPNERGPLPPVLLEQGVTVSAGNVPFITRDPLNVLPVQARAYYKRRIDPNTTLYETYRQKYEAVLIAELAAQADAAGQPFPTSDEFEAQGIQPEFYEPVALPLPTRGNPNPVFNLAAEPLDRSLYLALLAPEGAPVDQVRNQLANQVLSIGISPALDGDVPALLPQVTRPPAPAANLIFELPNTSATPATPGAPPVANYDRPRVLQQPDVFSAAGIVMIELPGAAQLDTWSFEEPEEEGTGGFPPRLEDDELRPRLITWLRIRLADEATAAGRTSRDLRLTWVGINAARVTQAVPVFNEYLGLGSGEPDQIFRLANTPVLPASVRLAVEGAPGSPESAAWRLWRQTDDLLAAGPEDEVFSLDPEAGEVRCGNGLRGARPRAERRLLVSYEFGGGPQGNVAIDAINASRDVRLQGGFVITNPLPTQGGALGETVAEGERRIPLVLRHRERLVTQQDFRDITRRTPGAGVGRVEVLPLFMPTDPSLEAGGVVTVLVIPRFDPIQPLWPVPDRPFLQRVCAHLDDRRLVTTEIYVRGPDYVPVYVSIGIQVRAGHFVDQVEKMVEQRLSLYLSALPPGGPEGTGWPLNKRLLRRDLEAVATRVPGVEYVESIEMGVITIEDVAEHSLSGLSLPRVAGITVRQGPAEPLGAIYAPQATGPAGIPIPITRAVC